MPEFFKSLPSCAVDSIQKSQAQKGLTKEEVAAIKTYTAECPIYKLLNQALRTEQLKMIEPWFSYLKLFDMALGKLPAKKGKYCRGENGDRSHFYTVGSTMTWVCSKIESQLCSLKTM